MNAKLPDGYRDRLCGLLQEEWRGGESYTKFATRLDLGSGKTVKAWLKLDFRAEPDSQKLRKLACYLGWEYWQLTRYLDTGERPNSLFVPEKDITFDTENNGALPIAVSVFKQVSDLATQAIEMLSKQPSFSESIIPSTQMPKLKNLTQAIADCLERSRQTPSEIETRIRDIRYYGSSEIKLTVEEFEAIRCGDILPTNEVTMEAIADVVDRDREVFTIQDWLSAWIVSIYEKSAKIETKVVEPCQSADVAF